MKLFLLSLSILSQMAFGAGYAVPVGPELNGHSYFDLREATAKVKDGLLLVDYQLPAGLVGRKAEAIHFEGKFQDSFITVEGSGVCGVCMVTRAKPMTCMLKYPELKIDATSRDEVLAQQFSGAELVLREQVARVFSNDPAGILMVELAELP